MKHVNIPIVKIKLNIVVEKEEQIMKKDMENADFRRKYVVQKKKK